MTRGELLIWHVQLPLCGPQASQAEAASQIDHQLMHMRQSHGPLRLTYWFRALLSTGVSARSLWAQPSECVLPLLLCKQRRALRYREVW